MTRDSNGSPCVSIAGQKIPITFKSVSAVVALIVGATTFTVLARSELNQIATRLDKIDATLDKQYRHDLENNTDRGKLWSSLAHNLSRIVELESAAKERDKAIAAIDKVVAILVDKVSDFHRRLGRLERSEPHP